MNKSIILRLTLALVGVVFFWVTLPLLFRVYVIVIPAIAIYFLLSKLGVFASQSVSTTKVYDITEVEGWKDKWASKIALFFNQEMNPFFALVRKVLMAVSVVIIVLVIGLFFLTDWLKVKRTTNELKAISSEIALFVSRNNRLPENLEEIIDKNPLKYSWKLDYWGNPIVFIKTSHNQSYKLVSFGKDGVKNTNDDLLLEVD